MVWPRTSVESQCYENTFGIVYHWPMARRYISYYAILFFNQYRRVQIRWCGTVGGSSLTRDIVVFSCAFSRVSPYGFAIGWIPRPLTVSILVTIIMKLCCDTIHTFWLFRDSRGGGWVNFLGKGLLNVGVFLCCRSLRLRCSERGSGSSSSSCTSPSSLSSSRSSSCPISMPSVSPSISVSLIMQSVRTFTRRSGRCWDRRRSRNVQTEGMTGKGVARCNRYKNR